MTVSQMSRVTSEIQYFHADGGDVTTHPPRHDDMRSPETRGTGGSITATVIRDARQAQDADLDTSGFQLIQRPTRVSDFLDNKEVMRVYYEECKALAKELTGASIAFTYDHLIREPGRQISGGGTDGQSYVTGEEAGGGYIGTAHMDYTDNTTWSNYLALHSEQPPKTPVRTISLNFWRGLSPVVDDYPLAICDARSVKEKDLFETVVYGYGASNYSWHDIGIETFSVKFSDHQRWFYYPLMRPDEVLVFKAYDSTGVIGNTCPHSAFSNPSADPDSPARRSIELRVLCFITD